MKVYLDGQELPGDPRSLPLTLAAGDHDLTLRIEGGHPASGIITTIVTAKPVEFRSTDGATPSER